MPGLGALLSIDLWHTHLAAVVRTPDGRIAPVAVDGAVVVATGIAVTDDGALKTGRAAAQLGRHVPHAYIRTPGQLLLDDQVTIGSIQLDPVDAMAEVLTLVAREVEKAHGTLPSDVVISTPAGWTPRQRQRLRAAATKAGLGQPRMCTGAESIVREQLASGLGLPVGKVAVVCRLAHTAGELVLLQREPDGYEVLAAYNVGELGETPGTTVTDQAAAALVAAKDAAGVANDQIAALLCDVPAETMPALASALTSATGTGAAPTHVGELAAAFGPTRTTAPRVSQNGRIVRPGREAAVAGVTAVVAWAIAATLVVQVLNSGSIVEATSLNPRFLVTTWYAWGLAPVFAVLGMVALAVAMAELRATSNHTGPDRPDPAFGRALILTAGIGVGVAVVFAIQGGTVFEVPPTPMLRWTLASTVPLALVLAVLGIIVARMSAPTGWPAAVSWRRRLRPPLPAVLVGGLAAVVLVAIRLGVPAISSELWWRIEHLAGYGLGFAVALFLISDPWRRATVGFLLSAVTTYAISMTTENTIVACLIVAITAWWIVRLIPAVGLTITAARRLAQES